MTRLLIGGYTGDKGAGSGITVLEDDEVIVTIPADSPSWIARHPDLPVLYAVSETDDGHVHAWSLAGGVPGEPLGQRRDRRRRARASDRRPHRDRT